MSIKNSVLAAAVASVMGASSAFALAPTTTPDLTVVQMGSSAVANVIEQVFIDFCASGTLSEYRNASTLDLAGYTNTATGGNNYRNYFCTMGTNAAIPSSVRGKNVLYQERLTGGSVFGVVPVGASSAQTIMPLTGCVAVQGAAPAANYACPAPAAGNTAVPDAGVSDVEPALFVPPNLPAGFSPLSAAQASGLTVKPLVQQVFQVVVGDGVKASVTNLSPAQLTSIFSGAYTDWGSINSALAGKAIVACARTAGSGTQAAFNAIFLNSPCSPSGGLPLGGAVTLNASTSAVVGCVNGVGKNSIGIVAKADGPTATDNYASVTIAGAAATAANGANGSYPYQVVTTLQYRSSTPAGTKRDLLDALAGILSTPSSLAVVNSGLPAGAALNALGDNGFTPDSPYVATNPVAYRSAPLNTCQPEQLLFP